MDLVTFTHQNQATFPLIQSSTKGRPVAPKCHITPSQNLLIRATEVFQRDASMNVYFVSLIEYFRSN
jgi:hypothetical protein